MYSVKRYFARPFTQATGDGLVYKLTRASVVQSYTCVQLWEMINEYPSFKMNSWTNTYIPNVNQKNPHILCPLLIQSYRSNMPMSHKFHQDTSPTANLYRIKSPVIEHQV